LPQFFRVQRHGHNPVDFRVPEMSIKRMEHQGIEKPGQRQSGVVFKQGDDLGHQSLVDQGRPDPVNHGRVCEAGVANMGVSGVENMAAHPAIRGLECGKSSGATGRTEKSLI